MAVIRFVTGPIGSGKTNRMEQWLRQAPAGTVGGILARKRWDGGKPAGYDLVLVPGWTVHPLANLAAEDAVAGGWDPSAGTADVRANFMDVLAGGQDSFVFGPFRFQTGAFRTAAAHLDALAADPGIDTLLIDEIGPLELAGGGHADVLDRLLRSDKELVLCVRSACLEAVRHRFAAQP